MLPGPCFPLKSLLSLGPPNHSLLVILGVAALHIFLKVEY